MRGLVVVVLAGLCLGGCTTPPPGSYAASAAYRAQLVNPPGLYGGGG